MSGMTRAARLPKGPVIVIEYRWAGNQADQLQVLGAVIVTAGLVATAKAATSNIPNLFVVSNDPVPQFGHKRLQSQRGGKRYAWASHSHHSAPLGPRQAGLFRELFNDGVCSYL
jgi:hypothetical protein